MDKEEKILSSYAKVMRSDSLPPPRFGHTVNQISKTAIVVFGGAISAPGNYTMSAELYLYDIPKNQWRQLTPSNPGTVPHARAAHASATVRENQLLLYGGSIGNGSYASPDLYFADIKNNVDITWMKVPIDGPTPGPRYGHSMVYILPYLILFGGSLGGTGSSQKNETMNDIWIFGTDLTPFKWQRVNLTSNQPIGRLYHSACVLNKYNDKNDAMIVFGGRDGKNYSLKDLNILKKDRNEFSWEGVQLGEGSVNPIARHQQCATMFGPFLMVVGGRAGNTPATFDVFSFNSRRWYRLGTIGLFRHSIWIYFNIASQDNVELFLYIYGGFDSENNSQINSNLYRINIMDIFSKNDSLKKELNSHINGLMRKSSRSEPKPSKIKEEEAKGHFEINHKVVVYNIPDENNFGALIKEVAYSKLTEVDKKINEKEASLTAPKAAAYDEEIVGMFLTMLTNPDEQFIPSQMKGYPFMKDKEAILSLISDCKKLLMNSPTVITLRSPIKIYGSIFGQYNDLIRYFNLFGRPSEFKGDIESMDYLFLGDIVNRGAFSLEVFCLLMALKLKYPRNFNILRGSHEDLEICTQFGLAEECKAKLGENIEDKNSVFKNICDLFEYLPLAAIINNQILCVHSGIGDHTKTLTDLNLKKPIKLAHSQVAQEILWSSPAEYIVKGDYNGNNSTTKYRNRTFNEKKVTEFLGQNNLKYLLRSHDVIKAGIDRVYNGHLITIFSAPNYCGTQNNNGSIIFIKKNYEMQPKVIVKENGFDVWVNSKDECPPSPLRKFNSGA
ncbi:MAG: metallophosphoesterase [archaeon]|nr:metallophosphoesterase [archaeon]